MLFRERDNQMSNKPHTKKSQTKRSLTNNKSVRDKPNSKSVQTVQNPDHSNPRTIKGNAIPNDVPPEIDQVFENIATEQQSRETKDVKAAQSLQFVSFETLKKAAWSFKTITLLIGLLAVLASFLGAYVAWEQMKISQNQAVIANKQLESAKEAIIGAKIDTNKVTNRKIVFTITAHNKGPQRVLATLKYCVLADLKPNLFHSLQDCTEGITTLGPFAILPDDSWPMMVQVEDPARIPLVRRRQLFFYFSGILSYSDNGQEKNIPLCAVYDEGFQRMADCMSVQAPSIGSAQ